MPDQCAITGTRLGKGTDAREGAGSAAPPLPAASGRNRLAALEVGSLAHQPATKVSDFSFRKLRTRVLFLACSSLITIVVPACATALQPGR